MSEIFVDREEELSLLRRAIKERDKVLIKGLRGIGKTTLLKKSLVKGIYINALKILKPHHLAKVVFQKTKKTIKANDPYEVLEETFSLLNQLNLPLAIDEFTTLIERFGLISPYRGKGGKEAVASHLRELLERVDIPILLSTTSLKTLSELTGRYTKPLARAFDLVIYLDPLPFDSSLELVKRLSEKLRVEITPEAKRRIVEFSGGNPDYIRILVKRVVGRVDVEEILRIFKHELREGYFNILFNGLLKELSPAEVEVAHLISRDISRFSSLSKYTSGINLSLTLKDLSSRGLVLSIKRDKRSEYRLRDKTFSLWLATTPFPGLKTVSFERLRVSTFGFEAICREMISKILKEISIEDYNRRKLIIPEIKSVEWYRGALGEVDILAHTNKGQIVGEAYFGIKCPPEKVDQLEEKVAIAEKRGGKVYCSLLISYFGFEPKTIRKAKQSKLSPYLLSKKELRSIAELVGYRKI